MKIDHFASAEDSNQFAMQEPHLRSWRFHRKSLIHAVLALEEQLRVANLIALATRAPAGTPLRQRALDELERTETNCVLRMGERDHG